MNLDDKLPETKWSQGGAIIHDQEDTELEDSSAELFHDVGDQSAACGKLDDTCKELRQIIDDIETAGGTKIMEGSLQPADFTDLIEQLEQIAMDLKGSLRIVEN